MLLTSFLFLCSVTKASSNFFISTSCSSHFGFRSFPFVSKSFICDVSLCSLAALVNIANSSLYVLHTSSKLLSFPQVPIFLDLTALSRYFLFPSLATFYFTPDTFYTSTRRYDQPLSFPRWFALGELSFFWTTWNSWKCDGRQVKFLSCFHWAYYC